MVRIFSLAIGIFYSFSLLASQEPSALQTELNAIFKDFKASAGVSVVDSSGREVFSYHSEKNFRPASVAKLVSTACSLSTLGPQYEFITSVLHTGSIQAGVLSGDLVIRGGGDFSFVIENLKMLVEKIRYVYGIKEIKGSLIFDTSFFSAPDFPLSEDFQADKGRAFRAVLNPVPLNHNSFSIWLRPDGKKAEVAIFPHSAIELQAINTVQIVPGRLNGSKLILDYRSLEKKLLLSGKIGASDKVKVFYRALAKPYESFASLFRENYSVLGGKWVGSYKLSSGKVEATALFDHKSRSLWRLLVDVNKLSTNFGAEMTALAAARKLYGTATNPQKVQSFLSNCLKKEGFSEAQINLENASGLSRQSSLQPRALSSFLYRQSNRNFWPEYLSSLSVLGGDGTTRSRSLSLERPARLKTGSLHGVRSISGVVYGAQAQPYFMTAILNCSACATSQWKKAEDLLIKKLSGL